MQYLKFLCLLLCLSFCSHARPQNGYSDAALNALARRTAHAGDPDASSIAAQKAFDKRMRGSNRQPGYRASYAAPQQDSGAAAAAAAALSAFGHALGGAGGGSGGCSSDYDCSYGNRCVKGYMQSYGQCGQAVNGYGTPTYEPPRSNFGVNTSLGCAGGGATCPIGYVCNYSSGVCYR